MILPFSSLFCYNHCSSSNSVFGSAEESSRGNDNNRPHFESGAQDSTKQLGTVKGAQAEEGGSASFALALALLTFGTMVFALFFVGVRFSVRNAAALQRMEKVQEERVRVSQGTPEECRKLIEGTPEECRKLIREEQ